MADRVYILDMYNPGIYPLVKLSAHRYFVPFIFIFMNSVFLHFCFFILPGLFDFVGRHLTCCLCPVVLRFYLPSRSSYPQSWYEIWIILYVNPIVIMKWKIYCSCFSNSTCEMIASRGITGTFLSYGIVVMNLVA